MAGGVLLSTSDKKRQRAISTLKSSQESQKNFSSQNPNTPILSPESRPKFSLSGVLFGNKSAEKQKQSDSKRPFSGEFLPTQSISKELQNLIDTQQQQAKQEIQQILSDISILVSEVKTIKEDIAQAVLVPPVEFNQYQVSFLKRIRMLVELLRKNIQSAGEWSMQFSQKSKKKKRQKRN